jgi:hypothetical protein
MSPRMIEMKSSNRVLLLFGAFIGLVAVVTMALVIATGNRPVKLLPEGTPEGTVQRYLLAIDSGDYHTAYNYLSFPPADKTTTYDIWRQGFNYPSTRSAYKATLAQSTITGSEANVSVVIEVFRPGGGVFNNPTYTNNIVFSLSQVSGAWKITNPTYVYWIY